MDEEVDGAMEEFANKFRGNNEKDSMIPQEYGQIMNLIEDENFNKHVTVYVSFWCSSLTIVCIESRRVN